MTSRTRRTVVIVLMAMSCMALPAWGQQYLMYAPQPVTPGQKPTSPEGILVQEIEVQKGDTLYGLSRKFSGHGMYFPQILLFNSIKNPHLIYPGNHLRIPVTHKEIPDVDRIDTTSSDASRTPKISKESKAAADTEAHPPVRKPAVALPASSPSTELSLNDLKSAGAGTNKANRTKKKASVHARKTETNESPSVQSPQPVAHKSGGPAVSASGQKLFETAVKAYRQDDCRTALELLDRYLADNSNSPLAADAHLYKADCYLKLSAQ